MRKAYVYIWPMLSLKQAEDIETALVQAGYENKRKTVINGIEMWRCS